MKKIITCTSLILAVSLFAEPGDNKGELKRSMKAVPLSSIYLSTENGGTNHASIVLTDGVGIYTTQEDEYAKTIAYLNGKYGDDALKDEKSLKEYVLDNGIVADKELANKLNLATAKKSNPGDSCDDGNPQTENDVYLDENFTCKGKEIIVRNSVKCKEDPVGSEITVDEVNYLVVDNDSIRNNLHRAETLCTSNVTDMNYLFYNEDFIGDITKWDVSNVTNMAYMFLDTSFNQDISNWDVSNLMFAEYMFRNSLFNQDISSWDISNLVGLSGMFAETPFNQNLSSWDLTNVWNHTAYGVFAFSNYNYPLPKINFEEAGYYGPRLRDFIYGATSFNQDLSQYTISSCSYDSTESVYNNFFDTYSFDMDILNYPERLPKIEFMECGSPGVW